MLVETMKKYYDKKYDLNCAECMLTAANEEYDLGLPKVAIKSMSAFGGGMGIGSVCGAITGCIAVLGIMFTKDRGHASPQVKEMTIKFINEFNKKLGAIDCIPLKEMHYKDTENRCIKMMEVAAITLDDIIYKNKDKYTVYR
ncbi:C-GCAxxG-C-C family (seleno)protein [Clostridium celatum]|uniref:Oxidoreductase n=1 Tax=Clostridium celatum DSM 1785 TaxID=545697 RepID=L1QLH6_9CLOT|nr:C-GCAxxG-C-C family (seleno)protein [Clostridium celatum]EKY28585.1 oxidoreductase [Clostridium celatum DSM 1785]MCE9654948.1 C-GCAxxG-C-C family protein [Clostridium celatum]MDU3722676.1 C-GCAxxG-C-C family (seleno)protein [Clostridium celatum]MDY3360103.1 C-GCAxxG-C-C family (seleno)protein [Clostridium celatum]